MWLPVILLVIWLLGLGFSSWLVIGLVTHFAGPQVFVLNCFLGVIASATWSYILLYIVANILGVTLFGTAAAVTLGAFFKLIQALIADLEAETKQERAEADIDEVSEETISNDYLVEETTFQLVPPESGPPPIE